MLTLEPATLDSMLAAIQAVGDAAGVPDRARAVVQQLRDRLDAVRARVRDVAHRPTVAAVEWLDPPLLPGQWLPEQIEIAGGRSVLGDAGQPAVRGSWDDVIWVQPEMVVLAPRDFDRRRHRARVCRTVRP